MAYYFMIEKKKGEYSKIDITKSTYFDNPPSFKVPGGCSLEEIDSFTTKFANEEELRKALCFEGLLDISEIIKPLSIRVLRNQTYKKVMYGFLYQKDAKYIHNPEKLIEDLKYFDYKNDFHFMQKIAAHYQPYRECNDTASTLLNCATHGLMCGVRKIHLDEVDNNGDNLFTRLLKLLIYKQHINYGETTYDYNSVVYRNLHSIIAFVDNYDKKYIETEKANDKQAGEITNYEMPIINSPKTRRLINKNKQIDGQISMFD